MIIMVKYRIMNNLSWFSFIYHCPSLVCGGLPDQLERWEKLWKVSKIVTCGDKGKVNHGGGKSMQNYTFVFWRLLDSKRQDHSIPGLHCRQVFGAWPSLETSCFAWALNNTQFSSLISGLWTIKLNRIILIFFSKKTVVLTMYLRFIL